MSRDRTCGRTRLASLEVVRRSLEDAGFEPSAPAREYEIGRLLTELVESELARLRGPDAGTDPPAGGATERLLRDFNCTHRELEAWSAVYYVYLRPDLNLGLREVEAVLGNRHRRTIQRRLSEGIVAIAHRLYNLERQTRSADRLALLATRLPGTARSRIIGTEAITHEVTALLQSRRPSRLVALAGPGGIGKTAIARAATWAIVASGDIDDAAWIDVPHLGDEDRLDRLDERIARQLAPTATAADARLILARRHFLVVVDGLDDPSAIGEAVSALRRLPEPTTALLTGRAGWSAFGDVHTVVVPPLAHAAAQSLLRAELRARGLSGTADAAAGDLDPVLRATAGHPLALRLAASQLRASSMRQVAEAFTAAHGFAAALLRDMWHAAWERAGEDARAVVSVAVRLHASVGSVDGATLTARCDLPGRLAEAGICEAVDGGLLRPVGDARRCAFEPGLFLDRYLTLRAGDERTIIAEAPVADARRIRYSARWSRRAPRVAARVAEGGRSGDAGGGSDARAGVHAASGMQSGSDEGEGGESG
jgi:hypothetical protein